MAPRTRGSRALGQGNHMRTQSGEMGDSLQQSTPAITPTPNDTQVQNVVPTTINLPSKSEILISQRPYVLR